MFDPKLLLQFAVVADTLSFTAAAQRLGVAQPWLSTRIRKLEHGLGFHLFDRHSRRVVLTPEGAELARLVAPFAAEADSLRSAVRRLQEGTLNAVRIGCSHLGEPDRQQGELLVRFHKERPSCLIEVEPGSRVLQLEQLAAGTLDVALMTLAPEGPDWETRRLYRVILAVMVGAGDPLSALEEVRVADLSGRRVATFARRRSPQLHDLLYGPMSQAGATLVEVPELRRSLLRSEPGLIVSTLVTSRGDAELAHGVVRRQVIGAPDIYMHVVRHRDAALSSAARNFWEFASNFQTA